MDTRQPFIIKCCLETACKECINTKMVPQNPSPRKKKEDKLNDSLDHRDEQESPEKPQDGEEKPPEPSTSE
jgi:hypothetical protein